MGAASLVLGIIGIIGSIIPLIGYFAMPLIIIGLILGIVELVKKKKEEGKKGLSIAGIILNLLAIIIIIGWTLLFGKILKSIDSNSIDFQNTIEGVMAEIRRP